jgi:F0F1-type ATP synthase assembly protein I
MAWLLGASARAGLTLALLVLAGIAIAYWLDRSLSLGFPWFTLLTTLIGTMLGPFVLYRWVTSTVAERLQERQGDRKRDEGEA